MSGKEKGFTYAQLLRVNSANAASNSVGDGRSLTDWVVDLGSTCQQVKRVSFLSCVFTNSAYNIISKGTDTNNTFTFSIDRTGAPDVVQQSLQITEGFYDIDSLMAAVETKIQSFFTAEGLGETLTLTQDSLTNRVSATYGKGIMITSSFSMNPNTDGSKSLWSMMGFFPNLNEVVLYNVPLVADYVPSLAGLRQVYLVSDVLASGYQIDEKGKFQNVAINIPVTAPFGGVNVWECKQDSLCEITYPTPRNLQRVDFKLTDEDGSVVNLNGSSVKVELKVWFNKT